MSVPVPNRQQLRTMLAMQDSMNTRVHPQWIQQNYEWYRAAWIECGELMDHVGYKWWKKQTPDWPQVQLEVIDIWHFGLSALFIPSTESISSTEFTHDTEQTNGAQDHSDQYSTIADTIIDELAEFHPQGLDLLQATEQLAQSCLATRGFSVRDFCELMLAANMDFAALYVAYVGKNVLNFFRQDHGYKDGSYIKQWQGKEDNEHLAELCETLDANDDDFRDQLYNALEARYRQAQASAECVS